MSIKHPFKYFSTLQLINLCIQIIFSLDTFCTYVGPLLGLGLNWFKVLRESIRGMNLLIFKRSWECMPLENKSKDEICNLWERLGQKLQFTP